MATPYDVVLYGATGFTGRQTAHYFAAHAPAGLRWAVAGRNRAKLDRLLEGLAGDPGCIVADSSDPASVDAMCVQARVLLTTAGPFAKYGDPVVDACVRHKTHYVDITGETPWVRRVIDRNHGRASEDGTRIVPLCGFDSIPSDLGTLMVVEHLRARGTATKSVSASFKAKGGLNGGTMDSAITLGDSGDAAQLGDTLLLNPPTHQSREERKRSRDRRTVDYDATRGVWLAPFFMAPVNTRVVRRSNALFAQHGEGYGPEFAYTEAMEMRSKAKAWGLTLGMGLFEKAIGSDLGRKVLARVSPDPGEGPSESVMDGGFFRVRLVGEGEDGQRVLGVMQADGDPGNRVTVKCLCESALALATQLDELPGGPDRGGVLTPAFALGLPLLDRLRAAGFEARVEPLG